MAGNRRPALALHVQPIADTGLGQHQGRHRGVGFDLVAYLADHHAKVLNVLLVADRQDDERPGIELARPPQHLLAVNVPPTTAADTAPRPACRRPPTPAPPTSASAAAFEAHTRSAQPDGRGGLPEFCRAYRRGCAQFKTQKRRPMRGGVCDLGCGSPHPVPPHTSHEVQRLRE